MAGRIAPAGGAGESYKRAVQVYTAGPDPRPVTPNRLQWSFLIFRAASIPSAARLPPSILRGFLEREANVKQTHRYR